MLSSNRSATGTSLVEALTGITVISAIAALALPSVGTLNRAQSPVQVGSVVTALEAARIRAMNDSSWLSVCGSSSGEQCDGDWSGHIRLYTDQNIISVFKVERPSALIDHRGRAANIVTFNAQGHIARDRNYFARVCATRGERDFSINPNGTVHRARLPAQPLNFQPVCEA